LAVLSTSIVGFQSPASFVGFIFSGPGVAEFTHFICTLLKPAVVPTLPAAIIATVSSGRLVAEMPNYWTGAAGNYCFPGPYTAALPMVPRIYASFAFEMGVWNNER